MAAGDLVQVGTTVEVGLDGIQVGDIGTTWLVTQSIAGPKRTGDVSGITDSRGATVTKLITNPSRTIEITGVVRNLAVAKAELTAIEALVIGGTVTLATEGTTGSRTAGAWYIDDIDIQRGSTEVRCTIRATREDSMIVTYGP